MVDKKSEGQSPSDIIEEIIEQNSTNCKYLELDKLEKPVKYDYLSCALHINIHSLPAKLDDLKHIIHSLNQQQIPVHFILLCETFLNDHNSSLCNIEGYNLVCENRKSNSRGGVAIYVLKSLPFTIRHDLSINIDKEFESLFIEVKQASSNIIVGEIYRVPNSNATLSVERFHTIINKLKETKHNVILGTDQNFDLLKYETDKNTKELLDGIISAGFLPTITKPTRITHSSATLIDNIYLKGFNYYTFSANIIDTDISDHLPLIAYMGKVNPVTKTEPLFF